MHKVLLRVVPFFDKQWVIEFYINGSYRHSKQIEGPFPKEMLDYFSNVLYPALGAKVEVRVDND